MPEHGENDLAVRARRSGAVVVEERTADLPGDQRTRIRAIMTNSLAGTSRTSTTQIVHAMARC